MRRHELLRKTMMGITLLMAGGTILQSTCINTIASLPICGAVLTFCTPADQINALFPLLEVPDFNADPTCTIPLGCGDLDPIDPPGGFPSSPPDAPSDTEGGGAAGGGAGGGGGGGGI